MKTEGSNINSPLQKFEDTIAVVGMHIRVPGADSLESFWNNLRDGVESITFFSDDELRTAGVDEQTLSDPDYVKAAGKLDGIEDFDASFFDMTPKEAQILDPQHRLLMEGVWKALEHAAIDPQRYPGRIGLYGGVGFNGYLIHHILTNPELLESAGAWQLSLNNDKDFATTRIAYKFNLQGPAISVNTACSTSLVATTLAAQSLLNYQCDTAIAGGCSVHLPQDQGYHFMTGGTLSPDGHCRPFDANAAGTIDGNGTASVVLKRYEDAVQDGDTIYAVIRGFAVNNDGSVKVGYTAPSVEGQADVILEALEMAGVSPDQIDFVETHGTGTDLGDSVEIGALAEAFKSSKNPCTIGSVKSNIGHLDTAAGVAGMIKVILSMQHGVIPPTCHFKKPNPTLGLEKTPFSVNNESMEWSVKPEKSRLAGISSFGIGGTNAHVIVGQAPESEVPVVDPAWIVLPISAKSVRALVDSIRQLGEHIQNHKNQSLADIAFTLQSGRTQFENRAVLVVQSTDHLKLAQQIQEFAVGLEAELSSAEFNDISVFREKNLTLAKASGAPDELCQSARSWLDGTLPDWDTISAGRKRVAIPGHPLYKQRYWIEPKHIHQHNDISSSSESSASKSITKEPNLDNWFYLPGWRKSMPGQSKNIAGSKWVIIGDSTGLADLIAQNLSESGAEVRVVLDQIHHSNRDKFIPVTSESTSNKDSADIEKKTTSPSKQNRSSGNTKFELNFADKTTSIKVDSLETTSAQDWETYFKNLDDFKPEHIIHAGLFQLEANPEETLKLAFEGLIGLGQALGHSFFSDEIDFILISDGIMAFDQINELNPAKSTALGPLRVMAQEYPNISTRAIDIDKKVRISSLITELTAENQSPNVVLRGAQRWSQYFEPIKLDSEHNLSKIKEDGVYLITGGLGDIGLTLAKHISGEFKVHFALLGRSEFPARPEWPSLLKNTSTSDRLKRQIQSIQDVESNGCTVQIICADVSDELAMKRVIDELERQYERIDGIIHAAGIVGQSSFVTLNDARTPEGKQANKTQFPSKVDGTEVLAYLMKDKSFDFCMVCSSLSPILGGLGFSAYAATNLYADALIEKLNLHQPGKWISVNWEGWMFDHDIVPGDSSNSSALELGMTPQEGIDIFSRIIRTHDLDRIVISSGNLQKRISQWVEKQPVANETDETPSHQRPIHLGTYTAPTSETEKQLVKLWGKLLGMDGIGVHDSFFELGGNSLLLTQLVAMIRKTFQAELALSAMFEHPTIAEIAKNIDNSKNGTMDSDDRDEGFI